MKIRFIHWFKFYWTDAVRILTVIVVGVLLIIAINLLGQAVASSKDSASVAQQNKTLTKDVKIVSDQNKEISNDNKNLTIQNQAFAKCNAEIFAKYTRDHQPVVIEDLEQCITTSISSQPSNPDPINKNAPTSPHTENQNDNTNQGQGSGNGDKPEEPKKNIVQRILDNVGKRVGL